MSDVRPPLSVAPAASRCTWRAGMVGLSLAVVMMLGIGGGMLHMLVRQAQRLAVLESVQKRALSRGAFSSLQASLSGLSTHLAALDNQVSSLVLEVTALKAPPPKTPDLTARVEALRQAQLALSLRLTSLQAQTLTPVVPTPGETPRPEACPSLSARQPRPVMMPFPPFVLAGTEWRGATLLAVVAPRGFTRLSQVQLLAPGASFMGWELRGVNPRQATFRSGHRQLILRSGL